MRELKFRAFDTENKTWTFVELSDREKEIVAKLNGKPTSKKAERVQ